MRTEEGGVSGRHTVVPERSSKDFESRGVKGKKCVTSRLRDRPCLPGSVVLRLQGKV